VAEQGGVPGAHGQSPVALVVADDGGTLRDAADRSQVVEDRMGDRGGVGLEDREADLGMAGRALDPARADDVSPCRPLGKGFRGIVDGEDR